MTFKWPDDSSFDPFNVSEVIYKSVDDHDIKAAILIPKGLKPGVHPVTINVHGGFLMNAHSLFAPFFNPWILKLALQNSAIIVSADYRLLPSKNGVSDILEDLEDFWQWTRAKLPEVLESIAPGQSVDFGKTLLTGGSAGGYCVMQLALSHPDEVSALAMAYPFLDPKDRIFVEGPADDEPTVLRTPLEDIPSKEATLEWIEKQRQTTTSKAGWERTLFNVASAQRGIFVSHVFDNRNLNRTEFFPLERLGAGARLPKKIWVVHGDDDSVVHVRASRKFEALAKKQPQTTLRIDIVPGEEHAFDMEYEKWESTLHPALEWVAEAWLGN